MTTGWNTLRDVMGALPVGVVVWKTGAFVEYANQRASEIIGREVTLGSSAAQAISDWQMRWAGTLDAYSADAIVSSRVFAGEALAFRDAELTRADGRRLAVEGWTTPVRDPSGEITHAVTTLLDVTEARRAAMLRDGEARVLEMVAGNVPLVETLDALARVFEGEAEGMLASILLVVDGNTVRHAAAPSLPDEWTKLVDGEPIGPNRGSCGTAAYLKEPVIVTDIATDPRWEQYRDQALEFGLRACWSTPILGPERRVLGTFAFYYSEPREPTQRLVDLATQASRLAAVAIQHTLRQAELKESVLLSTATEQELRESQQAEEALRIAKDAAEAATRAKSLFLANMSHEIRTPMNAVLGYAQLLQRDPALSDEQRRNVEVIRSSGNHLLTLINDILEMSKIEAGKAELVVRPFDLHVVLAELQGMFAALTSEKGIELTFQFEPSLARSVGGDAVKIRQVVINLLSNAIKFTDRGRIRLRASSRPISGDRVEVVIAVEDTGSGIASSDLTRIFNPFDRSASGVHTTGTGLGLAISTSFARLMSGELRVESVLGQGSTFTFSFEVEKVAPLAPDTRFSALSQELGANAGLLESTFVAKRSNANLFSEHDKLVELSRLLPGDLVQELCDAAIQARAGRIANLVERARGHSAGAAAEIEKLAEGFRYDVLLAALEQGRQA